jgi:hypothetical protein
LHKNYTFNLNSLQLIYVRTANRKKNEKKNQIAIANIFIARLQTAKKKTQNKKKQNQIAKWHKMFIARLCTAKKTLTKTKGA